MVSSVSDTLTKLRNQFAEQLPEKLEAIHAQYLSISPSVWQATKGEKLHRLLHSLKDIPVIAVTANAMPRGIAAGFND
jgi:CheY-like chemotaxis protein